jgi:hypothetical protein
MGKNLALFTSRLTQKGERLVKIRAGDLEDGISLVPQLVQLIFWLGAVVEAAALWLLGCYLRQGRWGWGLVCVAIVAAMAASQGLLWSVWGRCLLPHPSLVAYRPGMMLCPGQSASFEVLLDRDSGEVRLVLPGEEARR